MLHWNNKIVAGEVSSQDAPQLAHSPFTFLTTKLGGQQWESNPLLPPMLLGSFSTASVHHDSKSKTWRLVGESNPYILLDRQV